MAQEKYVFALTPTEEVPNLEGVQSFGEASLEALDVEELTAIVAPMPSGRLRPRRSNLRVHHGVIDHLIDHGASALPFAFGIATPAGELEAFIRDHYEDLAERIETVRGGVETTVRVSTGGDGFYDYLLSQSDELAAFRDQIYAGGREPTRQEKIEVGQRVDALRQQLSEALKAQLEEGLSEASMGISTQEPSGEHELAHLVCLVQRSATEEFEEALEALASAMDDELVIQLSPYLAPYHFSDLQL